MSTQEYGAPDAEHDADQQALDWYVRQRNGLTRMQQKAFAQWMRHPTHRQAFARWERDWRGMDALAPHDVALLRQGVQPTAPDTGLRRRRFLLGGAGLAACTVLGSVAVGRQWLAPLSTQDTASAHGQVRVMTLADGSRIELDAMTRVAVAQFADRVELDLVQGQAWFDMVHDAQLPYRIRAGTARVNPSGTLSVRHTPGQAGYEQVHVAMASGQAQLWQAAAWRDWLPERLQLPRGAVALEPGQQAWQDGAAAWRIRPVALPDIAPWRQDRLVVDDMPLSQVLGEFARYGHAVPHIDDPRVARMRITGTFHPRQPATFYRLLPQILPVRVESRAGGHVIVMVRAA